MITVSFQSDEKSKSLSLTIKGHAGQADIGQDIICSSASILAYTVAQFVMEAEAKGDLKSPPGIRLERGDAFISCEPTDDILPGIQNCYMFAKIGYYILAHNYPQYVEIKEFR